MDTLQFYSKSADKFPGKGNGEYVKNPQEYKELSKIKDWRKMLSNFYVSPFEIDNHIWNSVEHFYHANKFRDYKNSINYNYYLTFTKNGGKPWSDAGGPEAWAAGQAGKVNTKGIVPDKKVGGEKLPKDVTMLPYFDSIREKVMTLGFFAKFTQNEELKNMLLNTNDAELWHFLTKGRPKQLWKNLMIVRECIRKYDDLYDLKNISKFSSEKISDIFKKYDNNN